MCVSARTPPAAGRFDRCSPDLRQQVGREGQREQQLRARTMSSSGLIVGIEVPSIRDPCLAGEASATAGRRSLWTPRMCAELRPGMPRRNPAEPQARCPAALSQSRSARAW